MLCCTETCGSVPSCYGVVTSLNGEPEAGVFVEAVSRDGGAGCGTLQEEGKTEADGSFRIRGLQVNTGPVTQRQTSPWVS